MTEIRFRDLLQDALSGKPRFRLGHFPTPLEEAPRLSERLGVRIFIKRDDQTGLALGGNKVRKLEFLIGQALSTGVDTVITTGGSQSNHARITAAACRKARLDCYLILDRSVHPESQGNLLLDAMLGARVILLDSDDRALAAAEMNVLAERLRGQGRTPYVIPRGGSVPAGAIGYAAFIPELLDQLYSLGADRAYIYLGTGSTGTHSGVLAGLAATGASLTVQGISVSRTRSEQIENIRNLTDATLKYLGLGMSLDKQQVHVDERYRGPGYGQPTKETMDAIEIAALDEGLILDPVYTGKAMAGLIGHAQEGRFQASDTVVFLHTGGAPALFAYHREMLEALGAAAR